MEQPILAKPSGITLKDHTSHVLSQLDNHLLPAHAFTVEKYRRLCNADFVELTRIAVRWHDMGKCHPEWQKACRADYAQSVESGRKTSGVHLMRSGIRHEMDSMRQLVAKRPDTPPVILAAIAAHHSKLGVKHERRWKEDDKGNFADLWIMLRSLGGAVKYPHCDAFAQALQLRYQYAAPRALLQLADHRASAAEDKGEESLYRFKPFHYVFKHDKPQGVQEKIKELWDEPLGLLRAPTGAGKTDAALLWAQHQVEEKRADRLVIAMPTRFTANALSVATAESLSEVGLYHSTSWYQQDQSDKERAKDERQMARLLETPITVTTLDHLCICLTGTREDHHAAFFNLAHSCVVIDEADFYDDFTQANFVVLLKALAVLEVPALLMSATLPQSAQQTYEVAKTLPPIIEDTSNHDRPRCVLTRYTTPVVKPDDMADLLQKAIAGEPTIIYVNTVQRAQRLARWLRSQSEYPDSIVLYHSRYTEEDKKSIEAKLIAQFGRVAWSDGTAHGIAVLTQIGELSVNISANYMISELCPVDRLVQRVGRLARFEMHGNFPIGELHLITPYKEGKDGAGAVMYPAPYGTFKKGAGWEASPALLQTDEVLKDGTYNAAQFVKLVNDLYPEPMGASFRATQNANKLNFHIAKNWLIVPRGEITEDSEETIGSEPWRSRDIDQQVTLLTGQSCSSGIFDSDIEENNSANHHLSNWSAWNTLKLECGVTCYQYELLGAIKDAKVVEARYRIGDSSKDESEQAWLVKPGFYDSEQGLQLRDPEEDENE